MKEQLIMDEQSIREQICDICYKTWQLGWVAANDGNITVKIAEDVYLATPTQISKSYMTPDKIVKINGRGKLIEPNGNYRPSSEIKMHMRCYQERNDIGAVVHAHPPTATGFALAKVHMDNYSLVEPSLVLGSVPITPYGTPSTDEVPEAIAPYLSEHDVLLLENHGALTVGADLITAYYRMESLELWAKTSLVARLLNGGVEPEIDRGKLDQLMDLRSNYYKFTGKHPGYKKYNN